MTTSAPPRVSGPRPSAAHALARVRSDVVVARRHPGLADPQEDRPRASVVELVEVDRRGSHDLDVVADFTVRSPTRRRWLDPTVSPIQFSPEDQPAGRRTLGEALALDPDDAGRTSPWREFERINRRFATRAARISPPEGTVLILADGLYLTPGLLRSARPDLTILLALLEPVPTVRWIHESVSAPEVIGQLLGADVILCSTMADTARLEVAAVALNLADPCSRGLVTHHHTVELQIPPRLGTASSASQGRS